MHAAAAEHFVKMSMPAEIEVAVDSIEHAVRTTWAQWIRLASIPGSGKSSIGEALRIRWPQAVVLPMDGYHLPRRLLDAEVMRRRGAPHAFDHQRLRTDLLRLIETGSGQFP